MSPIDDLFGPTGRKKKPRSLRIKIIRPVFEWMTVGENAAEYLSGQSPLNSCPGRLRDVFLPAAGEQGAFPRPAPGREEPPGLHRSYFGRQPVRQHRPPPGGFQKRPALFGQRHRPGPQSSFRRSHPEPGGSGDHPQAEGGGGPSGYPSARPHHHRRPMPVLRRPGASLRETMPKRPETSADPPKRLVTFLHRSPRRTSPEVYLYLTHMTENPAPISPFLLLPASRLPSPPQSLPSYFARKVATNTH